MLDVHSILLQPISFCSILLTIIIIVFYHGQHTPQGFRSFIKWVNIESS